MQCGLLAADMESINREHGKWEHSQCANPSTAHRAGAHAGVYDCISLPWPGSWEEAPCVSRGSD